MTVILLRVLVVLIILSFSACGGDRPGQTVSAPEVKTNATDDPYDGTVAKPGSPYAISYRIIGTPIVGSPLTVDLRITSALAPRPMTLDYRINDATSMMFAESQPESVRMELAENEDAFEQRVTVIPQREGRFYLNVSASFESDEGTVSTGMAIPIQVGSAPREMQEHGELQQDENGEAVRVLSGD